MGSLKTFALAGAMALGASAATAADLAYPAPPPPEPLGLKGTISSGFYLRGDIGVGSHSYDELDVTAEQRSRDRDDGRDLLLDREAGSQLRRLRRRRHRLSVQHAICAST